MKSVVDDLRREQRERILALTPAERIALLETLKERDLQFLMAAQGVPREEAIRSIRASRRRGRRPSGCAGE